MLNAAAIRILCPKARDLTDDQIARIYHKNAYGDMDYSEFEKLFQAAGKKRASGRAAGEGSRGKASGRLEPELHRELAARGYGYDDKQGNYYKWGKDEEGKECFDRTQPLTAEILKIIGQKLEAKRGGAGVDPLSLREGGAALGEAGGEATAGATPARASFSRQARLADGADDELALARQRYAELSRAAIGDVDSSFERAAGELYGLDFSPAIYGDNRPSLYGQAQAEIERRAALERAGQAGGRVALRREERRPTGPDSEASADDLGYAADRAASAIYKGAVGAGEFLYGLGGKIGNFMTDAFRRENEKGWRRRGFRQFRASVWRAGSGRQAGDRGAGIQRAQSRRQYQAGGFSRQIGRYWKREAFA